MKAIVAYAKERMAETGIKLLWGDNRVWTQEVHERGGHQPQFQRCLRCHPNQEALGAPSSWVVKTTSSGEDAKGTCPC